MPEDGVVGIGKKRHIKINNTAILFIILAVMFALASYFGRPFFFSRLNLGTLNFLSIIPAADWSYDITQSGGFPARS